MTARLNTSRPSRPLLLALLAWLLLAPTLALAETRAWLDRDSIELGESVTLNIETDAGARPDYAPLANDFRIEQRSSRQSHQRSGGRLVSRTLYAVALQPQRAGQLAIPALGVGSERTAPVTLTVNAASAAPARARGATFIEAELDTGAPYVQQPVALRLRLYHSTRLLSGQFDQPAPEGAVLQRTGSDVQYTREIAGTRYQVVERRYVLVPERSGRVELPPARFSGRGVGGWLDDQFGDGQRPLSALGPSLVLDVKPVPASAPRPWLPLHGLELRWLQAPDAGRAGDAVTVELEIVAKGATAAQIDAPVLGVDQGAQVFPEPAQHDETFEDGLPRVRMVRQFSVLPAREGRLRIEAPVLGWWDVEAGEARETVLPSLELDIAPAAAGAGAGPRADGGLVRLPGVQNAVGAWALAAVAFALLWLATLAWALQWRQRAMTRDVPGDAASSDGAQGTRSPWRGSALRKALDTGDLGEVAAALCALASPAAADLDALSGMLAPGPQREAVAGLQRARWGADEGGAAHARAAVRAAFARGPDWLRPEGDSAGPLPPLYPR